MKTRVIFILLLAAAFVTTSCTKSKQQAPQPPLPNLTMYKVQLTASEEDYMFGKDASGKLITLSDSVSSGVYTTNFEYGANGKVSKNTSVEPGGQPGYAYLYEYDANARIRRRVPPVGAPNAVYGYSTYGYDAAGHVVADSLFVQGGGPSIQLQDVFAFKYAGDNVTEIDHYLQNNGLQLDTRKKFEYDNAPNPFSTIENYFFYNDPANINHEVQYISRNNIVKEYTATGTGDYQLTMTYSYEYNTNGYPAKCKVDYNATGYAFAGAEFVYK